MQTVQHTGLQDPVEAGKCTQAEGSGDASEMGEPITAKIGTLSPGILLLVAFSIFFFHAYFESPK